MTTTNLAMRVLEASRLLQDLRGRGLIVIYYPQVEDRLVIMPLTLLTPSDQQQLADLDCELRELLADDPGEALVTNDPEIQGWWLRQNPLRRGDFMQVVRVRVQHFGVLFDEAVRQAYRLGRDEEVKDPPGRINVQGGE